MKTIAVLFGGESVEHDVSILTAIQFMNAMDRDQFKALPVYIDIQGRWWIGEVLKNRNFYPLTPKKHDQVLAVRLPDVSVRGKQPFLQTAKSGMFSKGKHIPFDLVIPAIHGTHGEDGTLQGLLDFKGIPYGGCDVLAAASTMNKAFTKDVVAALGVPVLPHVVVTRGEGGGAPEMADVKKQISTALGKKTFPVIVKPRNLGSSIGVSAAKTEEELLAALLLGLRLDAAVIIEPFVDNLVEYNVAVSKAFGQPRASVIERPLKDTEFLDFKGKYLSGDDQGSKMKTGNSEGMASLNREINPKELNAKKTDQIKSWALTAFTGLGLAGSVRIDFLGNEKTGQLWLNEINTVPGSFAFYLWQESDPSHSFTSLTTALITEGLTRAENSASDIDLALGGALIFKD
jgi:D-alanine-D-alanine ligase